MSTDRDLLRRAWPQGCLPVEGVQTITGWRFTSTCVIFHTHGFYQRQVPERMSTIVHLPQKSSYEVQKWIDEGDLLPYVSPEDPATWACLLQDLAEAAGIPTKGRAIRFTKTAGATKVKSWFIRSENFVSPKDSAGVTLGFAEIDDPAEALLWARIYLRELEEQDAR